MTVEELVEKLTDGVKFGLWLPSDDVVLLDEETGDKIRAYAVEAGQSGSVRVVVIQ